VPSIHTLYTLPIFNCEMITRLNYTVQLMSRELQNGEKHHRDARND